MLNFAWRWTRDGDHVLVHDRQQPEKRLIEGTVAFVERAGRVTRLGVRIVDGDGRHVVWPAQACVHPDPLDPEEQCSTCDESELEHTTPI